MCLICWVMYCTAWCVSCLHSAHVSYICRVMYCTAWCVLYLHSTYVSYICGVTYCTAWCVSCLHSAHVSYICRVMYCTAWCVLYLHSTNVSYICGVMYCTAWCVLYLLSAHVSNLRGHVLHCMVFLIHTRAHVPYICAVMYCTAWRVLYLHCILLRLLIRGFLHSTAALRWKAQISLDNGAPRQIVDRMQGQFDGWCHQMKLIVNSMASCPVSSEPDSHCWL